MQKATTTAEPFVPEVRSLPVLRKAVQQCRSCDLYRNATQAVFGEIEEKPKHGQLGVAVMMIGEQPGDKEAVRSSVLRENYWTSVWKKQTSTEVRST